MTYNFDFIIYIYIIYNISSWTTQYEHIWILIQFCFVDQHKVDPLIRTDEWINFMLIYETELY